MNATELLDRLKARGITLRVVENRIQAKPTSSLLPEDRTQLQLFKAELVALIRADESPDEVLNRDERERLMTETIERLHSQYKSQAIDWNQADTINTKIGQTFRRRELTKLLHQYEMTLTGQPCD